MPFILTAAALLALLLAGCDSPAATGPGPQDTAGHDANPCDPGDVGTWAWEDAQHVDDFVWEDSDTGGGWPDSEATMSARAAPPGLRVTGEDLPFVGGEPVEGFYRRTGEQVVVLVQPVDMDPDEDSCTSPIRIEAGIPEEPPAPVTLYRRSHNPKGGVSEPELIGCVEVES